MLHDSRSRRLTREQGSRVALIGDVHGKVDKYLSIVSSLTVPSLQVGDMGLGDVFFAPPKGADLPLLVGHRFIRGNHDSPQLCRAHPNYQGDFGIDDDTGIFWVSGAFSVDRQRRLASASWWPDEELCDQQWMRLLADYERLKPEFVVSHECPASVNQQMLDSIAPQSGDSYSFEAVGSNVAAYIAEKRKCAQSPTSTKMDSMLRIHRPQRWVFGHYHMSWEANFEGTQFFCLAELQMREFEL